MARVHGITYRQSQFLRALVEHPAGPPEDQWPHPTILRRWLRRPPFRSALDSLLGTLRYEADLRLAFASTTASRQLQQGSTAPADAAAQPSPRPHLLARDLLKLSHTRQRFAPPIPPPPVRFDDAEEFLKTIHPEIKLGEALDYYHKQRALAEQRYQGQLTNDKDQHPLPTSN